MCRTEHACTLLLFIPVFLQLCSGPILHGMLLAGPCAIPSLQPHSQVIWWRGGKTFHPCITSARPSVWATLEGAQRPWRPPLSSPFPSKLWRSNPYFGVMSYCLMPLWDERSAKPANSARWAQRLCPPLPEPSNCVNQLHASHNNREVGTPKADAHPVINTNQSPDSWILQHFVSFCCPCILRYKHAPILCSYSLRRLLHVHITTSQPSAL